MRENSELEETREKLESQVELWSSAEEDTENIVSTLSTKHEETSSSIDEVPELIIIPETAEKSSNTESYSDSFEEEISSASSEKKSSEKSENLDSYSDRLSTIQEDPDENKPDSSISELSSIKDTVVSHLKSEDNLAYENTLDKPEMIIASAENLSNFKEESPKTPEKIITPLPPVEIDSTLDISISEGVLSDTSIESKKSVEEKATAIKTDNETQTSENAHENILSKSDNLLRPIVDSETSSSSPRILSSSNEETSGGGGTSLISSETDFSDGQILFSAKTPLSEGEIDTFHNKDNVILFNESSASKDQSISEGELK